MGILEGVALTWDAHIALQAWGKTATVPLAWMTLKFLVIAPAMNVLIATVLIVKLWGDLTHVTQTWTLNFGTHIKGCMLKGDGHV